MNSTLTYAEIVDSLSRARVPVRHLHGPGHVAITLAAGRVVAMAVDCDGPSLLWSNPTLGDAELIRNHPERAAGNLGGDRLWFAPELDYFWDGVPDWHHFSNYQVPPELDPGSYEFVDTGPNAISLRADIRVPNRATGNTIEFTVERTICMAAPPIGLKDGAYGDVKYVGIKTFHRVELDPSTTTGRLDLWHLLQVPPGSLLIVPLKSDEQARSDAPLLYCGSPAWSRINDCILWRCLGTRGTKFGLSSTVLTGRTGVIRSIAPEQLCLIVREFSVSPRACYGDHPYDTPRTDQALQIWDGLGFGELEHHSPMLSAEHGQHSLQESDYLWAFTGTTHSIRALAIDLLGTEDFTNAVNELS